jgi:hypothetical protein
MRTNLGNLNRKRHLLKGFWVPPRITRNAEELLKNRQQPRDTLNQNHSPKWSLRGLPLVKDLVADRCFPRADVLEESKSLKLTEQLPKAIQQGPTDLKEEVR